MGMSLQLIMETPARRPLTDKPRISKRDRKSWKREEVHAHIAGYTNMICNCILCVGTTRLPRKTMFNNLCLHGRHPLKRGINLARCIEQPLWNNVYASKNFAFPHVVCIKNNTNVLDRQASNIV